MIWQNGINGMFMLEIKNFGVGIDLCSCGKNLYELLDNAKLYTSDRQERFIDEAYEPHQQSAVKEAWAQYHKPKDGHE